MFGLPLTYSPKPINPDVFPSIAFSLVCLVDIWCKSILLDQSKHISKVEDI